MLFAFVPSLLAALTLAQPADTTVNVQRGQRLELDVHGGSITVRTWSRNAIRFTLKDADQRLQLSSSGSVISADASEDNGAPADADVEVTAPAWLDLTLTGINTDIRVEGSEAPMRVETVEGDIAVRGGRGQVSVQSVDGSVTLTDAQGHLQVSSVNDAVTVQRASGSLHAESTNGDVLLDGITSNNVEAVTVNGDLRFNGPLADGGVYRFSTHNGDITLGLSGSTGATFYVSTFSGDFDSEFPVTLTGSRGKRHTFTLGSGAARVELESFQGDINLRRASGR